MQLPTLLGASCLLALCPWIRPVGPAGPGPQEPRRIPREERIQLASERLHGAWQLVSCQLGGVNVTGGSAAGYLLVQPEYLALEVHLSLPSSTGSGSNQPFFQSGTFRWRLSAETTLETSTLIGNTNIGEDERWDFEAPGTKRSMVAVVTDTSLTLERPGESRMVFRRLARLPYPDRAVGFERGAAEKSDK